MLVLSAALVNFLYEERLPPTMLGFDVQFTRSTLLSPLSRANLAGVLRGSELDFVPSTTAETTPTEQPYHRRIQHDCRY